MYCKKCGSEIIQNSYYCLKCGTPLQQNNTESQIYDKPKKTPVWLKIIAGIGGIIVIIAIVLGVSYHFKDYDFSKGSGSFIDDKYIIVSGIYFDYASVFKFSDGDLVQIVSQAPGSNKVTKYYGTYEIDGHKLTISVYGSEIGCVLIEDKNIIAIDGKEAEILDCSERKIADESTMNAFD